MVSARIMEFIKESRAGGRELYVVADSEGSEVALGANVGGGGSFSLFAAWED